MHESEVLEIIKSSPKSPEAIFANLGLPVWKIEGAKTSGTGRSRRFNLYGKEHYSPEVLAKAYFESQGHLCYWSEGLVHELVIDAIKQAASTSLFDHLHYTGNKKHLIPETALPEDGTQLVNNSNRILAQENWELKAVTTRTSFPISFSFLWLNNVSRVRQILDGFVSISCDCSAEQLISEFGISIEAIRKDKRLVAPHIKLPPVNEHKTDPSNFFKTEWALKFAHTILEECNIDYLLKLTSVHEHIAPRWDLTVIDATTKQLRFVEVKYRDDLTREQMNRIPMDLRDNAPIELCVIKTD